jgi:preprotein translocase SecE subunit
MLKKVRLPKLSFGVFKFFSQVSLELKRVEWLKKDKTFKYSLLVIVAIIMGLVFLIGVDRIFLEIRKVLL